jgi:hypothetical protein
MGAITRAAANNFTTSGVILPAGINDTSVASLTELENVAAGGALTLISEQTASSSSSVSFTSGIDSTYPIYRFDFINIHPSNTNQNFRINFSTDGGSSYNVTKTTTFAYAYHKEDGTGGTFTYDTSVDAAQSTGDVNIMFGTGNQNNESLSGSLFLYNPSSTTFVKHFISDIQEVYDNHQGSLRGLCAGYGNTTSSIDAVKFLMSAGTLDSGTIKLYGISGS